MARIRKPSVKIILYTHKTLAAGNSPGAPQHPVLLRVTYHSRHKYYSTRLKGTLSSWSADHCRFIRNKQGNMIIARLADKAESILNNFEQDSIEFTFDRFEKKCFPSHKGTSVFDYFESIKKELLEDRRLGTFNVYKDTLYRIKKFRAEKDLTFHDIDSAFLTKFEKFLKRTNSMNSIGIYLRTLRAAFNRAIKDGYCKQDIYPFKGYRISGEPTRKRSLSADQVEALKSYLEKHEATGSRAWHSLNFFLLSYYCRGMNFADIGILTWDDIRDGRIFYRRKKTKGSFDLPIDEHIARILSHYSTATHFIFPILVSGLSAGTIRNRLRTRLKKCNADLQSIAKGINKDPEAIAQKLNLPEDITFYWGRHTFATRLKRAGVATAMISEALGHASEKTTAVYLDSFEQNQLDEIGKWL